MTRGILAFVLCAALAAPLAAQQTSTDRLRIQRDSLERIRRERTELQNRMQDLKGRAHSLAEEVNNLVRQAEVTGRAVRSLDTQVAAVGDEVESSTSKLVRAQDELAVKRAVLQRRLTDIYRRGPLFSLEVMLSAESFGALVARYKYLHEVARRDRAMVQRVKQLNEQIDRERRGLVRLQRDMVATREERADEQQRYKQLEEERAASLRRVERDATQAERRLAAIARDEVKLNNLIDNMEAERRRAAAANPSATPRATGRAASGLRSTGTLEWPVEGNLLYPFGRAPGPDQTLTSWQGIGIEAASGAAVRAVAAGVVKLVDTQLATFGATVVILHPSGEYSIYSSLGSITVSQGAIVDRGAQIGTVGTNDPRLPPHLHFEIRSGSRPIAVDPIPFLRPRP
jgi:septal ring factor EnvC (AmiA/AmiB activator)